MPFSETQLAVNALIQQNGALKNPHEANIAALQAAIDQEIIDINNSTNPFFDPGIPPVVPPDPTPGELIIEKLEELRDELDEFRDHTDRLSGIVIDNTFELPSLQSLFGVGSAIEFYYLDIGRPQAVATQRGKDLWGSLYLITDAQFAVMKAFVETIVDKIQSPLGPFLTFTQIITTLTGYIATLNLQPIVDNNSYNAAVNELITMSLTYGLVPLKGTVPDVILREKIGTTDLINLLNIDQPEL